jgi:hypothetical protein
VIPQDANVDLDVGSIVSANMSIGNHPAIVLSSKEEIAVSGEVFVVAISANDKISDPDDLIKVPNGLGMKKKCYVQCGETQVLPVNQVKSLNHKAWGQFLVDVRKQVKVAMDRRKQAAKPTQK